MLLVIKDYFEGSSNVTKKYQEDMIGFKITNDHNTANLTFTINNITISVKAQETFRGTFNPFRSVLINSTVPFRATVSALFNGTENPPPSDTTAPILTITPSGTFSDSQTVTMTTNETAAIYYTIDGTEPTTSSLVYTAPITLTETTTIKAFAIDTAGNASNIQTVLYTRVGIVTDGLVLHYDFSNRAGDTSNTITDRISNVPATLVGVTHDGSTDGYVDNKGLLLQIQDYVQIPTDNAPLNNVIDFNGGLTIQMVSYDTNGSHWRTDDGKFTSAKSGSFTRYRKNDGGEGTRAIDSFWFVDSAGVQKSYQDWVNPIGSSAVNVFTLRINADNTASIFINDAINANGRISVPADFDSYINSMAMSPLQLRRNFVGHNTAPETLAAFMIYNRELSDNEVSSNYFFFQK